MTEIQRTRWESGARITTTFQRMDGSLGAVHPMTVVADDGRLLLGWVPVNTPIKKGVLADGRDIRTAPLNQRFRLPRKLIDANWTGTSTLRLIDEEHWSSVWWFFDGDSGKFTGWYVNLEIPMGRSASGIITCDWILDVAVDRDLNWRWKDEDELVAALDAGRISPEQAAMLRREGERIGVLAERGHFPFDGTHTDFRP